MRLLLLAWLTLLFFAAGLHAQSGFVRSGNQPIPGATVTATQGETTFSTVTDGDGHYTFPPLTAGTWNVEVQMFGFQDLKQDVDYASTTKPVNFSLQLQESQTLQRFRQMVQSAGSTGTGGGGRSAPASAANQAAQLESMIQTQAPVAAPATGAGDSNESFIIQGSLSQGLNPGGQADADAIPQFGPGMGMNGPGGPNGPGSQIAGFGQQGGAGAPGGGFGGPGGGGFGGGGFGGPGGGRGGQPGQRAQNGGQRGQFGNRRQQNQIRGQLSFTLNNSIWDAKPFSLTGQSLPEPAYAQSRFSLNVGGPLVIPKLIKDPSTFFFLSYFGTRQRNPYSAVATVPTDLEREGNFSQSVQGTSTGGGVTGVQIFDPATHQPYPGNIIPASQISPIALGLMAYIPHANQAGLVNNYQYLASPVNDTNNVGFRIQRNITKKDRLAFNMNYQNRDGQNAQPFQFFDALSGWGFNGQLQYTRTISATLINNLRLIFNRNVNQTIPYFSYGVNVAAELGIQGTSTNPANYGPPNLNFTNFGALSDGTPILTRNHSDEAGDTFSMIRGRHNVQLGIDYRRNDLSTVSDSNGRGTFNFTGTATSQFVDGVAVPGTGFDFADFLLGYPQSSSIRYGEPATYFTNNVYSAFATDNFQVSSNLTVTLGLRYEFFSPFTEKYGQMANLDIGPGFATVAVVTPGTVGPYSGQFPAGLIEPDYKDFSPRVGIAWKVPHQQKSTLLRAGYGIYYNGQAYFKFPSNLAQQPPFATSSSVNSSPANLLTLAEGFTTVTADDVTNTYAVEKNYRTPYAQTWNASLQHDLGKGLFVNLTYIGTKGTGLDVLIVPNQGPPGTFHSFTSSNITGYTYDESNGNSTFNALQTQLTQRFRKGISFTAFYQYGKSIDNSSSFGGAGNTVAQNWLDISAERGLSSFDRRQVFTGTWILTSPIASGTSRVAPSSWQGRAFKDWTLSGGLTAETGTPLTARVLGNQSTNLAQTGGVGSGRADTTGLPVEDGSGLFNLDAFAVPPSGQFGNAGRNTIPGPGMVALNLTFGRAFQIGGETRRRLEFRWEATNVLNQVNYTNLYTVVNASNYGLPAAASSMRSMDINVRYRF